MYKITLYDNNCCPICDGTTFWFVESLEEFEKNWLPLQARYSVDTIERYYKSKFGELVTDYYNVDDPELNIVQTAESEVLDEKVFEYTDKEVKIFNTYSCATDVLFDKLKIELKVLKYGTKCYLVGKYYGQGCKRVENGYNRWYNTEIKYSQMGFYGNPIAEYTERDINWDDWDKSDAYKDFYTNDPDFYKHEQIECFVWLPIKRVETDYKICELSGAQLGALMRDIVGEAG